MSKSYRRLRNFLALGVTFLPFTSLRFGPVGVGELTLLVSFLWLFALNNWKFSPHPAVRPVLVFWVPYLALMFVGFAFNLYFLRYSSGDMKFAMFDQASYIFIFILTLTLGDKNLYRGSNTHDFFEKIFLYWAIVFSSLFLISYFTPSIAGYPLRYYSYFSPLVVNIHQAAMITSAMPFLMLFFAYKSSSGAKKMIFFGFAILFTQMAFESGTTKAWLATAMGGIVSVALFVFHRKSGRQRLSRNVLSYLFLIFVCAIFIFVQWSSVTELAVEFFRNEDGGSARENLYYFGFLHAMGSPFIGYGPGPHVAYGGGFSDAHSTLLTVLLQGGFVAVIIFIAMIARIFWQSLSSRFLVGTITAISIYALGGDILRRLPIWMVIIGVLLICWRGIDQTKPKPKRRRTSPPGTDRFHSRRSKV